MLVTAPERLDHAGFKIFLAGPIDMGAAPEWQRDVIAAPRPIVIDADSRLADAVRREGRVPLLPHGSGALVAKYVIPQMLADRRRVVCWDLQRFTVSRCGQDGAVPWPVGAHAMRDTSAA